REPTGTSFALGRAYMSTNCANTNSTPRSCMSFQVASGDCVPAIARSSSHLGAIAVPADATRVKVRVPHLLRRDMWDSVAFRPERRLELDHLHGDLDPEPVVAPEIEARELADAPQPLAKRVRMDVQRLRGRADRAVPSEELLERRDELRAALRVVLGELA